MKKVLKSALSLLLACLLLIPGGIVFAKEPVDFTDVDADDWFAPYVDYCSGNGLVNGMTATTFEPNTSLSRAMFVTLLYRFEEAEATEGAQMPFTDVSEKHWAREAILWAYENEIVNGMTPTRFMPDGLITREQMCTMLCRFAEAMGYEMPMADEDALFLDDMDISEYAHDYVYSCAAAGIVNGMTEYTFAPKDNATRAQACTILQRFIRHATTTVTKGEAQGDKIPYEYADKYGVYAHGYEIVDGDGNVTKRHYEDGEYCEDTEYTYLDGKLVKHHYKDSDGNEVTSDYLYNEDGTLKSVTRSVADAASDLKSITLVIEKYSEDGKILELTATSEGYEEVVRMTQIYTEDRLSGLELKYVGTDVKYTFGYDAEGMLDHFTYSEEGIEIESVGDFDEQMRLPEKLTFTKDGATYDVSIGWLQGVLDVTQNGEAANVSEETLLTLLLVTSIVCELGNSFEEFTVERIMDSSIFE